jgi:hypothetical protein
LTVQDLTGAQKARVAVQSFKTIAHALALRGFYRPSEKLGQTLAECLMNLSPEIYGSMNDPRIVELNGLEYIIDRLPRGIEECSRIILTEEEHFEKAAFEKIEPLKRRRTSYRVSEREMCFVITRGLSEIYDILTHLTFLSIEAKKIYGRMKDESGGITMEWSDLEKDVHRSGNRDGHELDQAIWNLSIITGRTFQETRQSYESLEKNRQEKNSNSGLFSIIYNLGNLLEKEEQNKDNARAIYLTPSLMNIIGHQAYGERWARDIKEKLRELQLLDRPLHVISANLHSVVTLLYGYAAVKNDGWGTTDNNIYNFIQTIAQRKDDVIQYARKLGLYELPDLSGTHIDCQFIDTSFLESVPFHPDMSIDKEDIKKKKPVILVMDYAFGTQAFEVMDNLLKPFSKEDPVTPLNVHSISIMGKAGILSGRKSDIMLATAHVIEGTADNYLFENDLQKDDFDDTTDVYVGPMITVLGTSLQNRDMLKRFQSDWKTVGLEMEGGHYQRAISASIIKGHITRDVKVRYAYYASDNPLQSGQTLAAGAMGEEGIKPTYMITKVILEKIFETSDVSVTQS